MEQLERRLSRIDADYRIHKQFIKIKFSDFMQTTVEMVSEDANADNYRNLCEDGFERGNKPVRLLGVGVRVLPADSEKGNGATPDQLALTLD
jgi:DNA polymerase-4